IAAAGNAFLEKPIAAGGAIGGKTDRLREMRIGFAARHRRGNAVERRMLVEGVADRRHRGVVAAAPAGRAADPNPRAQGLRQGGAASSSWAPWSAQVRLSQTRTVSGGGAVSPSITMSKWA